MTPTMVRMVLVEGENAGGVTVDTDQFEVPAAGSPSTAPDQVISAILGTQEGATESGCQLSSIGVTWTEPTEAAALRDLLAGQKVEKVMLVSAFLAAAALAQTVGDATRYAHTALMLVEPYSATMAVVDTADGSVTGVRREVLPDDEYDVVATLTAMAASVGTMEPRPDGLFVVGSDGVDVAAIREQLQAATPLVVSTPEEPEIALARGAALASANPPLFSSSTAAVAYAQDPGTGAVDPHAVALAHLEVRGDPERGGAALAYSADPDEESAAATELVAPGGAFPAAAGDHDLTDAPDEDRTTRPFLVAMSVLALFVGGVVALVVALAIAIRPHVDTRPHIGASVVAPATPAPPAPPAPAPAQPAKAPAAPARPAPAAPAPAAPAPPPALPLPAAPIPAGPPGPPPPGSDPRFPAGRRNFRSPRQGRRFPSDRRPSRSRTFPAGAAGHPRPVTARRRPLRPAGGGRPGFPGVRTVSGSSRSRRRRRRPWPRLGHARRR